MSGIYGPILAVLTFFVLVYQIRLQEYTNKHMYDQSYIQDSRADIEFYLSKLTDLFESTSTSPDGAGLRRLLHEKFARPTVEQLKNDEWKDIGNMIDREFHQLQASWSAFNGILKGLQAENRFPYELQLASAQQKAIATLSYPTCASLDNYLYCRTEGRIAYPYLFTTSLTSTINS